jgi:prepilin-type N-terminal cleavage/methylation domain-containing protein
MGFYMKFKKYGFTLLELLITMAIALILSVIAVPNYHRNIEKWQLQQAELALDSAELKLASWKVSHENYAGASLEKLGISNPEHYKIELANNTDSYKLIATRQTDGKQIIRQA